MKNSLVRRANMFEHQGRLCQERPGRVVTDPLYIRLGLTIRGPYSLHDLHELAGRGSFSQSHEVSSDKKTWTSASGHPELFPAVRRPQPLDRNKRIADSADAGIKGNTMPGEAPQVSPDEQHLSASSQQIGGRVTGDELSSPATADSDLVRPISQRVLWAVIAGPTGFILLLVCTAMIVIRLRLSPFAPAENIGLMVLLGFDFVLGVVSVALGHLAINQFETHAGTNKERNLIVIGLSCGYTILILSVLFTVVLLISAFG